MATKRNTERVARLAANLSDRSEDLRVHSLHELLVLGPNEYRAHEQAFVRRLCDRDPRVRLFAAEALIALGKGSAQVARVLIKIATDAPRYRLPVFPFGLIDVRFEPEGKLSTRAEVARVLTYEALRLLIRMDLKHVATIRRQIVDLLISGKLHLAAHRGCVEDDAKPSDGLDELVFLVKKLGPRLRNRSTDLFAALVRHYYQNHIASALIHAIIAVGFDPHMISETLKRLSRRTPDSPTGTCANAKELMRFVSQGREIEHNEPSRLKNHWAANAMIAAWTGA